MKSNLPKTREEAKNEKNTYKKKIKLVHQHQLVKGKGTIIKRSLPEVHLQKYKNKVYYFFLTNNHDV
jgi:hypothetical protein